VSKKIKLFSVALVVFVVVLVSFAGTALASYNWTAHNADHSMVAGSPHDRSTTADPNPCDACHIPHGAKATGFLWAKDPSTQTNGGTTTGSVTSNDDAGISSNIKPMCYSCHDGGVTAVGVSTVMSAGHSNHRTRAATATDPSTNAAYGPGKDCDRCHDPHDDTNKNLPVINSTTGSVSLDTNGRPVRATTGAAYTGSSSFLKYEYKSTRNGTTSYRVMYPGAYFCSSCHSNMANTTTAGTHPVSVVPGVDPVKSHAPLLASWLPATGVTGTRLFDPFTLLPASSTSTTGVVACESCHSAHGAEPAATYLDTDGVTIIHGLNTMTVKPKPALDGSGNPLIVNGKPVYLPVNASDPSTVYLCANCH
jgi:hypothetical protein